MENENEIKKTTPVNYKASISYLVIGIFLSLILIFLIISEALYIEYLLVLFIGACVSISMMFKSLGKTITIKIKYTDEEQDRVSGIEKN